MTRPSHKRSKHRATKNPAYVRGVAAHARKLAPVAAPLALIAAVAAGAAASSGTGEAPTATQQATAAASSDHPKVSERDRAQVSRTLKTERTPLMSTARAKPVKPKAVAMKYVTTDLNVRAKPSDGAKLLTVLSAGKKVGATTEVDGSWAEVVYKGEPGWVKKTYLAAKKPAADATSGEISGKPCASGSDVENGLTENAIKVHRAVCAKFPEVTSYGGVRSGDGGEHGSGHAVDIMVSGSGLGDEIAAYARANAARLGISQVIWSQRIWTTQRSSEGWRSMPDRGSATANHYDHVHVTVN